MLNIRSFYPSKPILLETKPSCAFVKLFNTFKLEYTVVLSFQIQPHKKHVRVGVHVVYLLGVYVL
jgi:hypothetical protein